MKSDTLAGALRWVGAIGIASIAVMRCATAFAPQVIFDVDPASDSTPFGGLGPAGSMVLDVALLVACAIAWAGELWSRRGIDVVLCLLALIPVPVVLWHGGHDAGDLWRGSTWAAAVIACATAAHLARDRAMRIFLLSALAAIVVPVLARGAAQISFEHADMVRLFEESKDRFLPERGWGPDSSDARIFERRLRQPQPTGWFATSNIFGSFMAFGLVLWIGLALAAVRAKLQSGWAGAMILLALSAGAGLWLSGSKGAVAAAVVGLAVGSILHLRFHSWHLESSVEIQNPKSKIQNGIVIALVILTLLAVIMRGTLLPESFAGEKSLLFRWHYMVASAGILADAPLVGVGPDGYQEAYILHRVERNPEEVASAHSMFWDWLCALGAVGASWISMVAVLLWRAGRSASRIQPDGARPVPALALMGIAAIGLVPAMMIEWPALDGRSLLVRVGGVLGFVVVASMLAIIMNRTAWRLVNVWLVAATGALVVHGQIDMTFHQPGSMVWAMCLVGIAGQARTKRTGLNAVGGAIVIAGTLALAGWTVVNGVVPAMRQQHTMSEAAKTLHGLLDHRDDAGLIIQRRQTAARLLVEAYEKRPADVFPLNAAVRQLELASMSVQPPSIGLLMQAQEIVERAVRERRRPSSITLAIQISARLGMLTGDQEHWSRAIELARRMTELDPNGLGAWRRLGDVLWLSGNRQQAAGAYQRALQCDEHFALDELKRLSENDRRIIHDRIEASAE